MNTKLAATGKYIFVNPSNNAQPYYGYQTNNVLGAGNVRFNTMSSCFEVYDGSSWRSIDYGYSTIGLTSHAESILDWASKKMTEEFELDQLANQHESIKDLVDQIKESKEKIKALQVLLR